MREGQCRYVGGGALQVCRMMDIRDVLGRDTAGVCICVVEEHCSAIIGVEQMCW